MKKRRAASDSGYDEYRLDESLQIDAISSAHSVKLPSATSQALDPKRLKNHLWSRMLWVRHEFEEQMRPHKICNDVEGLLDFLDDSDIDERETYECFFDPEEHDAQVDRYRLADHKLGCAHLHLYAV